MRSIRNRILLWFVSAVFLVMLLSSLSFYFYTRNFLYTNAERLIRDKNFAVGGWIDFRIKDMNSQINGYKESQEANIFIQVSDLNRKTIGKTNNLKDSIPLSKHLASNVYSKDNVIITRFKSSRYGEMLVANGTGLTNGKILGFVQVAIQEKEITKTLDGIICWLVFSIPLLLLFSFVLGRLLTKKLISPFVLITNSANSISINEIQNKRLPVVNPDDELGKLTLTVNQLLDRLAEAVASQQQFVADAAHELRTPLAIMQGEIEIAIRNGIDKKSFTQLLDSTLEEVHRLSGITENLIALSRLDVQEHNITKEFVDIRDLCHQVKQRFSSILKEKHITCTIEQGPPFWVEINKAFMEQVLINLVDNAIKYSLSKTEIIIDVERQGNYTAVSIKDNGLGIPKHEIPFIFNRFYRVDKSRSSEIKGSGLGLSIIKSIVDLHQGLIEVRSQLNVGTEIKILLP